jgi:hypothetical protein
MQGEEPISTIYWYFPAFCLSVLSLHEDILTAYFCLAASRRVCEDSVRRPH